MDDTILTQITDEVKELYDDAEDDSIREWFFEGHVLVVRDYAIKIAKEQKADQEIVILAALFHDVARAWGVQEDQELMDESLEKMQSTLSDHGYSDDMIEAVEKAIVNHSCKKDLPETVEGKVLATADALAHLMTDFYLILAFNGWSWICETPEEYAAWIVKKNEKEFHKKIFFDKYKKLARPRYEAFKTLFS